MRVHIFKTTTVQTIFDFHDLAVFDAAFAYSMIFNASNRKPADGHAVMLAEPLSLAPPYPNVIAVVENAGHKLPGTAFGSNGEWCLAKASFADKLAKMRAAGPTLKEYLGGQIFNGVKGLTSAFIVTDDQRDTLLDSDRTRGYRTWGSIPLPAHWA